MKKIRVIFALCAITALLLSACGGNSSSAASAAPSQKQVFEYKISTIAAMDDPFVLGYQELGKMLDASGWFKTTVYGAGSFSSSEGDAANQAMENTIQQTHAPSYVIATLADVPEFYVYDYPYLFTNNEELLKVANSDLQKNMSEKFLGFTGLRLYSPWVNGWMGMGTTKKPLNHIADLKNVKLRTPTSPVMLAAMGALGISAIPLGWGEVFTAMQQGVVDGCVTTVRAAYTSSFQEIMKYWLWDKNSGTLQFPMVNNKYYQSLPEEAKKVLDESMVKYVKWMHDTCTDLEGKAAERLQAEGVTFAAFTPADQAAFKAAGEKVLKENANIAGQATIDHALAVLGRK